MHPDHDALTPSRAPRAQSLSAHLALLVGYAVQLTLLLFSATLNVFELAWRPLLFSALLEELGTVLLERGNGEQDELVILGELDRRPGDHHGSESLVTLDEFLLRVPGHDNKVCFDVLRILNEERRVDNGGEGLGRQVATRIPVG